MRETCIVTGGDGRFFEYLRGAIESIRAHSYHRKFRLCAFDFGLEPDQKTWLASKVDAIAIPQWHFHFPGQDKVPQWLRGLLARPFLKDYFPGAEIYLWLDADSFVLDWSAIQLFEQGASARGMAIVPELDRGSRYQYGILPQFWNTVAGWYAESFGSEIANELRSYPLLNAGVFAIHHDAPHWSQWKTALIPATQRKVNLLTDQMALNYAIYRGGLFHRTEFLPAWCNWGCVFGMPAWDGVAERLVEPYLPHTPIGILHRTGPEKGKIAEIPSISGGSLPVRLHYPPQREVRSLPEGPLLPGDYVSPGLRVQLPDQCFPNLIEGNPTQCDWPYLRREIPHRWLVDRRAPLIGCLSRDEAAIVYNTALRFRGRRALVIGCRIGWSTCHFAMGGVSLDVLDPAFADSKIRESIEASLSAAGVRGLVNWVSARSPEGIGPLAGGRKWSLMFVDGNHDSPAPLQDAQACAAHAAEDALILFHDLACPAVGEALDWLRGQGWQTLVYQTMQIMGVAWRGKIAPVTHVPDPAVKWQLPDHLKGYAVT